MGKFLIMVLGSFACLGIIFSGNLSTTLGDKLTYNGDLVALVGDLYSKSEVYNKSEVDSKLVDLGSETVFINATISSENNQTQIISTYDTIQKNITIVEVNNDTQITTTNMGNGSIMKQICIKEVNNQTQILSGAC